MAELPEANVIAANLAAFGKEFQFTYPSRFDELVADTHGKLWMVYQNEWTGKAGDEFRRLWNDVKKRCEIGNEQMRGWGQKTSQIAETYEEKDRKTAARLNAKKAKDLVGP